MQILHSQVIKTMNKYLTRMHKINHKMPAAFPRMFASSTEDKIEKLHPYGLHLQSCALFMLQTVHSDVDC